MVSTIMPLGDYFPCRFTPAQTYTFMSNIGAYQRINHVIADFFSKDHANQQKAAQAQQIVKAHAANDTSGMADDLVARGLISQEERAGLKVSLDSATTWQYSGPAPLVGCSQSLLTWQETSYMFGRAVADTYMAVQVNVRNLDDTKQFLLHDVQVAIADPSFDRGGKPCSDADDPSCNPLMNAGREHILARGLQSNTNWSSPRNITVTLASSIAGLGVAAASLTGGLALRNAFSVFSGTAVPLLQAGVPDLSIVQLRLLDDMAFSSSSVYKILVPKGQSVPFVTFVPLRIYVQKTGKEFKKADSEFLNNLAKRTFVVVSGKYLTEDTAASAAVASINCPTTPTGTLDLTKTSDASATLFTCSLVGTSLGDIAKVRLKNAKDSGDVVTVDGAVTVQGGDPTKGSAAFPIDQLKKLKGTQYAVFSVTAKGQEKASGANVTLGPNADGPAAALITPALTGAVKTDPPATANTEFKFTVSGSNFDPKTAQVTITGTGCSADLCTLATGKLTIAAAEISGTTKLPAGSYQLTVQNGAKGTASNALPITVTAAETPKPPKK
jgi:hypothetical protein